MLPCWFFHFQTFYMIIKEPQMFFSNAKWKMIRERNLFSTYFVYEVFTANVMPSQSSFTHELFLNHNLECTSNQIAYNNVQIKIFYNHAKRRCLLYRLNLYQFGTRDKLRTMTVMTNLCSNTSMVHPGHPQSIITRHSLPTNNQILHQIISCR